MPSSPRRRPGGVGMALGEDLPSGAHEGCASAAALVFELFDDPVSLGFHDEEDMVDPRGYLRQLVIREVEGPLLRGERAVCVSVGDVRFRVG